MEELLQKRGNYKDLITYKKSVNIYDITYFFVCKYLKKGDRTVDQMVQAARSGKQNIVEGCSASVTSKETEIKLLNVAKASLVELREDYEDYLRVRGHRQWEKDSAEMAAMRKLGREHSESSYYMSLIETRPDYTIANMAIVLLKQIDYLLARQLQALSEAFLREGGLRERMTRLRKEYRGY